VDPEEFRSTFRHHAGGVVVITLDAGFGPVGFTATSLTSVSGAPPLVSFAIGHSTSSWPHLIEAGSVVVNFLSHDQQEIATIFATSDIDRFAPPLRWGRLVSGEPVLTHSRRWLRCRIARRVPVGDHDLVIGEIIDIGGAHRADPTSLVYHGGRFHAVGHG
jgi:flavin reductase (DIM6/NTAB) family NADH-FMN oxidoreductase RutF